MSDTVIDDIPPYQGIDLILGKDNTAATAPVKGWAITHPVLDAEMFEDEAEADRRVSEISCSQVQYPLHTSKCKAWLHTEGNRKHWSPR